MKNVLIVSDYMCVCLVLFVVSKILDSSELLSCLPVLEMGVEYYLVRIRVYSDSLLRSWSRSNMLRGALHDETKLTKSR